MRVDRDTTSTRPGWVSGRVAWARSERRRLVDRVDDARERSPAVRFLLTAVDHDRVAGGALLAGALAFRLFLWLLPACLVVVGSLGFFRPSEADRAAATIGFGGPTAATIETATAQAHEARWILLATGLVALFSTSLSLARTMWVATTLAWQLPIVKLPRPPRAAATVVGLLLSGLGLVLVANWVRSIDNAVGLVATVLLVVAYSVLGWVILRPLPRPPGVADRDLVPGAILIGVGVEVMHLVTVLYLGRRLESASQLYGALGGAATMMLWTYLLARVLIGATTVNRAWVASRATSGTSVTRAR